MATQRKAMDRKRTVMGEVADNFFGRSRSLHEDDDRALDDLKTKVRKMGKEEIKVFFEQQLPNVADNCYGPRFNRYVGPNLGRPTFFVSTVADSGAGLPDHALLEDAMKNLLLEDASKDTLDSLLNWAARDMLEYYDRLIRFDDFKTELGKISVLEDGTDLGKEEKTVPNREIKMPMGLHLNGLGCEEFDSLSLRGVKGTTSRNEQVSNAPATCRVHRDPVGQSQREDKNTQRKAMDRKRIVMCEVADNFFGRSRSLHEDDDHALDDLKTKVRKMGKEEIKMFFEQQVPNVADNCYGPRFNRYVGPNLGRPISTVADSGAGLPDHALLEDAMKEKNLLLEDASKDTLHSQS